MAMEASTTVEVIRYSTNRIGILFDGYNDAASHRMSREGARRLANALLAAAADREGTAADLGCAIDLSELEGV